MTFLDISIQLNFLQKILSLEGRLPISLPQFSLLPFQLWQTVLASHFPLQANL